MSLGFMCGQWWQSECEWIWNRHCKDNQIFKVDIIYWKKLMIKILLIKGKWFFSVLVYSIQSLEFSIKCIYSYRFDTPSISLILFIHLSIIRSMFKFWLKVHVVYLFKTYFFEAGSEESFCLVLSTMNIICNCYTILGKHYVYAIYNYSSKTC